MDIKLPEFSASGILLVIGTLNEYSKFQKNLNSVFACLIFVFKD